MSVLKCVSVYDSKSESFASPFFVPTLGVASRSFVDEVKRVDPSNMLNSHPEDFELFHVGDFDTDTGVFAAQAPVHVIRAADIA